MAILIAIWLLLAPLAGGPVVAFSDACVTPTERTVVTFIAAPWVWDDGAVDFVASFDGAQVTGTAQRVKAGVFAADLPGMPTEVAVKALRLDLPGADLDYTVKLGLRKTHPCAQ
jgi:hypothetical protein